MSSLFACFLGPRQRRNSSVLSETSDFSASGLKNRDDGSSQLEVVYVELLRGTNQPLGLVLEGGTDRDKPVQVAELYSGGVAEQSNALQIGDHIRSINGTVTDYLTNKEARSLLKTAGIGNVVNLEIAYDTAGSQKLDDGMELKTAFVTLLYEEMSSNGFIISGGRLDNRPITVSHVKPESYPYKKGVLRVGDRILQVNGKDMRNASQTDFSKTLKQRTSDSFTLQIEYDVTTHEGLEDTAGPLMVELQKPHGASLGISLSGDPSAGKPIYISRVRDAGIADRSGALHVGDHLLSINGQQLEGRTVHEASHMLAHSDINVILEIMPSHSLSGSVSRAGDGLSLTSSRMSRSRMSRSIISHEFKRRPSRLSISSSLHSSAQQHQIKKMHPETMPVEVRADEVGFGMALEGGSTEYGLFPITISSIEVNGPAARLGQVLVGDRVIAINGQKLLGETLQQAYKLIQEGDDILSLEVEFDVEDPPSQYFHTNEFTLQRIGSLQWGITLRGNKDKLWIASVLMGGIASRKGCFSSGDILVAVNGQSVVEMLPKDVLELINGSKDVVTFTTRREMINNFASRRSPQSKSDDVIYSVELDRGNQNLGIILQGSERKGQPIIISLIKEGGVAHRTRALREGDRVLAINGESLFSKSLDDAKRILETAGSKVTLKISKGVVSRRRQRNRPGGSARNYRNPRNRFNRALYPSHRVSSRVSSQTSDSELSTIDYLSETNLERPSSNMRHSPRGSDMGRIKSSRYNDPSFVGGAERYSPSNRPRYSPPNKGRNSPIKELMRDKVGTIKSGGIPSGLSQGELSGVRINKRHSFNETTDEETMYDEDNVRPGKLYNGGYHYPKTENGILERNHSSRLPRIHGSLSRERKKVTDRLSPVGKSPDGIRGERRLQLNHQMEEAILQQLEDALLKSKNFVDKLTELANHSGSSDQDSDSEPLRERLRPHLKQQLLKHVKEIMIPQQTQLIDVKLTRSSHSAGFGLSLSDGLFESGVYVNQIQPGGPADIAGLCTYDRIIKFNDQFVEGGDCCQVKPMFSQAGEEIILKIARNPLATNNGAAAHSTTSPVLVERESEYEEEDGNEYC